MTWTRPQDRSRLNTPDEREVREQLQRLLASDALRDAQRSSRLLRFVVEETLAGRAAQIKEFTLGADALERGPAFDPRVDPIARVEASRLRTRLEAHYAAAGAAEPVVISLPKGTYVPRFEYRVRQAGKPGTPDGGRRQVLVAAMAGGAIGLAGGLAAGLNWRSASTARETDALGARRSIRLQARSGVDGPIITNVGISMAITPDGSALVFVAARPDGTNMLFVRELHTVVARELPGTLGARHPFVSPDGRWVAFLGDGKLKKTRLDDPSSVAVVADVPDFQGGSWGTAGMVGTIAPSRNVLVRIDIDGGSPRTLLEEQPPVMLAWPQVVRNGEVILFTWSDGTGRTRLEAFMPATGARRIVAEGATYGRYLASGHIAYVFAGTLFVLPFDLRTLRATGAAVAMLNDVAFSPTFGIAQFDVSDEGTLVYREESGAVLTWIDNEGGTRPLQLSPGRYQWPRISPDGTQVAYTNEESGTFDLWMQDIAGGDRRRISRGNVEVGHPTFSPDGQYIVYGGRGGLHWARVDQSQVDQVLDVVPGLVLPASFNSRSGELAFWNMDPKTGFDIWTVPTQVKPDGLFAGTPRIYFRGPGFDVFPQFSPDGRWVTYASDESGTSQVYVRAFPDTGHVVQVSTRGGRNPKWSVADNRILYLSLDRRIMQADWTASENTFRPSPPRLWSSLQLADITVTSVYDVDPRGRGIVALLPASATRDRDGHFVFVTNFFDEIRRREKAGLTADRS